MSKIFHTLRVRVGKKYNQNIGLSIFRNKVAISASQAYMRTRNVLIEYQVSMTVGHVLNQIDGWYGIHWGPSSDNSSE